MKYPEGGYSFSRITTTQVMIGVASLALHYSPTIRSVGVELSDECSIGKAEGFSLEPICLILMAVDFGKGVCFDLALRHEFTTKLKIFCFHL